MAVSNAVSSEDPPLARWLKRDSHLGDAMGCPTYGDGSKPWYLVNPKIAGKWMFIPLKMVLIGIDPYPYLFFNHNNGHVASSHLSLPEST